MYSGKLFYPLWIGSYVSCQGTHVLEKTVQVARYIRSIVRRSSTEVVGSCRRESQKHGVWHGLCNMGIVLARSYHEKSVPLSMPHVNGNVRQTLSLPHPVQRGTPTHQHTRSAQAVAQRLRTMGHFG